VLPPANPPNPIPIPVSPPKLTFKPLPWLSVPETTGVQLRPEDASQLDAIQRAGFQKARVRMDWADVEKQRGTYDFSRFTPLLEELKRRKIQPLVTLTLTNPIYDAGGPLATDAGRAAFAAFAGAVAGQFRDTVRNWEIGDAPNALDFPNGGTDYAALLNGAAKSMKAANSRIFVLSGGVRGVDAHFLRSAFAAGAGEPIDGVGIQPVYTDSPEGWPADFDRVQDLILDQHLTRNLEIWVTDWTYQKTGSVPPYDAVRELLLNYGKHGMATFVRIPDGDASGPTLRTVEYLNRTLAGADLKRVRELPAPLHGMVFKAKGGEVNVLWSSGGEVPLTVRARKGTVSVTNAIGEVQTAVPAQDTVLKITDAPVYLEGPLTVGGQ
jgi:hypothetical protein